jgi:hypothetical protein
MQAGDLFMRPTIGGGSVACVIAVKTIGAMTYLDFVDEAGFVGLLPAAGISKKPVARGPYDNGREMAALAHAIRIGRERKAAST